MEEMISAGLGTPQSTGIVDMPFAADDKSFAVNTLAETLTSPPGVSLGSYLAGDASMGLSAADFVPIYLESLRQSGMASIFETDDEILDRLSTPLEERFMVPPPKDIELMLGGYLARQEEEAAAMVEMEKTLAAWVAEAEAENKFAGFVGYVAGVSAGMMAEAQTKAMEEAFGPFHAALLEQFDRARRLIHKVRKNIALKRYTLKPVVFTLDWLDLVVRRRRRIGVKATATDRLFSLPSCGGWSL